MILASTTAAVTAAISAAAGLLGVGVGHWATMRREERARREAAKRDLDVAALRCLARAEKIRTADDALTGTSGAYPDAERDRNNEIRNLGPDLDAYVVAIAAVEDPTTRARHWRIYEKAGPILIGGRTEKLRPLIKALEEIRTEVASGAPTRLGRLRRRLGL
jgi:hypothetical protein